MIHKFKQGDDYILLDVNSGAVHIIDEQTFKILDDFDGTNDAEILSKYPASDTAEILSELHELIDAGELFAPGRQTFARSSRNNSIKFRD